MNFFLKYRLQINIVLFLFWAYILFESISSVDFSWLKIIIPIVFIAMAIFNIYKAVKLKK